jgi:hypothetical protein
MEQTQTFEAFMEDAAVEEYVEETTKKQPIVGRIWMNEKCVSGYVVIAPGVTIKFAGSTDRNPTFIYLSKK